MTQRTEIRLSAKGLQSAARIARNDFRFVIGSDDFPCDRFQAAFLSPIIGTALEHDPTIDQFVIKNCDSQLLNLLRSLILGATCVVEKTQLDIMKSLCEGLGNSELSEQVVEIARNSEELTLSDCISRLRLKSRFDISITSEADFIGSHFFEFTNDALRDLKALEIEDTG
jgi:hypothetical protein